MFTVWRFLGGSDLGLRTFVGFWIKSLDPFRFLDLGPWTLLRSSDLLIGLSEDSSTFLATLFLSKMTYSSSIETL